MIIESFDECVKNLSGNKKPHLLIGNGFSISCRPTIFTYGNLYSQASKKFSPKLLKIFENLNTRDFELVMKALKSTAILSEIYEPNNSYKEVMLEDANLLKNILVETIASSHPAQPNDILDSEYKTCRQFLSIFEDIYTLNYDLLLYWASMHTDIFGGIKLKHDDGFRTPDEGKNDYVSWNVENSDQQNIFYLHGALHLFDAGGELQKYTWVNTGIRLIEQVRTSLDKDSYPLFVSEGTSSEKKEKIYHSGYLMRCYRSFSKIGGTLFIYGHSLADNDDHILNLIPRSRVKHLYISIFGDFNDPNNKSLILKTQKLIEDRNEVNDKKKKNKLDLHLHFYDASKVPIWK